MPKKNKKRRLWLNVKFKFKGKRRPPEWKIKETLLRSIEKGQDDEGEYTLPKGWDVLLEWRNKEHAKMRSGPWAEELEASASSSPGFNEALIQWLERWDVALVREKKRRAPNRSRQSRGKIRPHGKRGKKAKKHRKRKRRHSR